MTFFKNIFKKGAVENDGELQSTKLDLSKIYPRLKSIEQNEDPKELVEGTATKETIDIDEAQFPYYDEFAEGLGICYVIDKGDHFSFIQKSQLVDEQLVEQVRNSARENLNKLLENKVEIHGSSETTHYMITLDGNFEATLLTIEEFCDSLEQHVGSRYYAAIPSRDLLLVATESDLGLQNLTHAVIKVFDDPESTQLLNRGIYKRVNNKWHLMQIARK